MAECIFCDIIAGKLPATVVYEDAEIIVFHDIHPKASVHLLVVPKVHQPDLFALEANDAALMGRIVVLLPTLAREQGLDAGFRTIVNTGAAAGQLVGHIHFHLLGGARIPSF